MGPRPRDQRSRRRQSPRADERRRHHVVQIPRDRDRGCRGGGPRVRARTGRGNREVHHPLIGANARGLRRSRLRLTEALEVSTHRVEEDENDRQGEVNEQGDRRVHEGYRDGNRRDHGTDREPEAHLVDQRWIQARFDQAPVSGQVPPNQVAKRRQQPEDRTVEAEGDGVSGIRAQEGRCERDQGDAHEEENVQPHERAVHAQNEMEYLLVGEPVDSQDDETDEECRETGPQRDKDIRQTSRAERRGRAEFQDEDRHRDREDSVDEGLQTIFGSPWAVGLDGSVRLPRTRDPGLDHKSPGVRRTANRLSQGQTRADRTAAAIASMNRGSVLGESVRHRCTPCLAASSFASMSTSYRISKWSETNPNGATRTAFSPASPSSARTSSSGGPSHSSSVRPALCQAIRVRRGGRRWSTSDMASDSSRSYGSPASMSCFGRLWAVKTTTGSRNPLCSSRSRPAWTFAANIWISAGSVFQLSMYATSGTGSSVRRTSLTAEK